MPGTTSHPIIYSEFAKNVSPLDWNAAMAWLTSITATDTIINNNINIGANVYTGDGSGITNIDGQNIPFSQSGFVSDNLNDAVEELMTQENLWNRVGTTLSQNFLNDNLDLGLGNITTLGNLSIGDIDANGYLSIAGNLGVNRTPDTNIASFEQTADNAGLIVYGFDDENDHWIKLWIASNGGVRLSGSERIFVDPTLAFLDDADIRFGGANPNYEFRYDSTDNRFEFDATATAGGARQLIASIPDDTFELNLHNDLKVIGDDDTYIHSIATDVNSNAGIKFQNDAVTWTQRVWGDSGDRFTIADGPNQADIKFVIETTGDIGIAGATNPQAEFQIGPGSLATVGSTPDKSFQLSTETSGQEVGNFYYINDGVEK